MYDTIRFITLLLQTDWYKSKTGWLGYLKCGRDVVGLALEHNS